MSETTYCAEDLFSLAGRVNNQKRTYLLVNPLQAKHVPVSPAKTIRMCKALAKKLPASCRELPTLLIGFAETATAIGAILAKELGEQCSYLTTTREQFDAEQPFLYFSEVHSHATEQKLCTDRLEDMLRGAKTIILLDDELTTGNTILNLLGCLAPYLSADCRMVSASVINRMNAASREKFAQRGVEIAALCYSEDTDATEAEYTAKTTNLNAQAAMPCADGVLPQILRVPFASMPRKGVHTVAYADECAAVAQAILPLIPKKDGARILILGTEECMAPAIWAGAVIEQQTGCQVRCHATTRSPIAICDRDGYPAKNGVQLKSLYDPSRVTYLYNLDTYDAAFIVTDAHGEYEEGLKSLCGALTQYNTNNIIAVLIGD